MSGTPPAPPPAPHLRAAGQATRDAIERAARALFAEHGFNDTSVRAIAAAAGVDPALVIRHFGSKESLFLATVDGATGVQEVLLEGPLETLGRRLVTHYLAKANTRMRQTFVAMVQASHRPQVRREMARLNERIFLDPLAERLTGDGRDLRAVLVWSQLSGLMHTLLLSDSLAETDDAEIIATYGDTLQRLITP